MNKFKKGSLIEKKGKNYNKIISNRINAKAADGLTSVSDDDLENLRWGYVVCQENNEKDHWFVSEDYINSNYNVVGGEDERN